MRRAGGNADFVVWRREGLEVTGWQPSKNYEVIIKKAQPGSLQSCTAGGQNNCGHKLQHGIAQLSNKEENNPIKALKH